SSTKYAATFAPPRPSIYRWRRAPMLTFTSSSEPCRGRSARTWKAGADCGRKDPAQGSQVQLLVRFAGSFGFARKARNRVELCLLNKTEKRPERILFGS